MTSLLKILLTAALVSTLLAACATLPPADPSHSGKLHQEAMQMTAFRNYPDAIAKYAEAIMYNPQDSRLYLKQAEVQEVIQQFAEASRTYQLALDRLPKDHIDREYIHYRLGLLQSRSESKHRAARRNLAGITTTWMKLDLEGMIALHTDNSEEALRLFSRALEDTSDFDEQARVYYHASLAHYQMKEMGESKKALFHAVNNASSLALKQHIRIFFDLLR